MDNNYNSYNPYQTQEEFQEPKQEYVTEPRRPEKKRSVSSFGTTLV